jgi:hypothetical protein
MENVKRHCTKVANWLAVEFTAECYKPITNRMEMELVLRRKKSMIMSASMTAIVDRTLLLAHNILISYLHIVKSYESFKI